MYSSHQVELKQYKSVNFGSVLNKTEMLAYRTATMELKY